MPISFFTDLKIIWEELEFLRLIPNHVCHVPYNCDLSSLF